MKKSLTSLIIKEMEITVTLIYHFTTVRVAIIQEIKTSRVLRKESSYCRINCHNLIENSMKVPQKVKMAPPMIQQSCLWLYHQKSLEQDCWKYLHSHVHCKFIHFIQDIEWLQNGFDHKFKRLGYLMYEDI